MKPIRFRPWSLNEKNLHQSGPGAPFSKMRMMALLVARSPAPSNGNSEGAAPPADIDGLFRQHARAVAALGRAMLGRADEVEDLVQDVFVRAWRGLHTLEHPGAAKSWLITIAVRTAHTRRARRRLASEAVPTSDVEIDDIAAPAASPDEMVLLGRLRGILEKLPVDLRIAWVLRHVQAETVEEVAAQCGWSLSTAKRRLAVAHRRVMRRMHA